MYENVYEGFSHFHFKKLSLQPIETFMKYSYFVDIPLVVSFHREVHQDKRVHVLTVPYESLNAYHTAPSWKIDIHECMFRFYGLISPCLILPWGKLFLLSSRMSGKQLDILSIRRYYSTQDLALGILGKKEAHNAIRKCFLSSTWRRASVVMLREQSFVLVPLGLKRIFF